MMNSSVLLLAAAAAVVVVVFASFTSMAAAADGGGNINTSIPSINQDMVVAEEEMQRANYFAFVMLINLAPPDLFPGNVTFLMPNDRTLAKNSMPQESVADFLLRHSIPAPLLMETFERIPTGSILPTSKPDLVLGINNRGRHSFFLSNVRIISPNICTLGSSIRCHGIDGIIQGEVLSTTPSTPPAADQCHYNTTSPPSGSAAAPPPTETPGNNNNNNNDNNDTIPSSSSSTAAPPTAANRPKKSTAAAASVGMFSFVASELVILGLTLLSLSLCV